MRIDAIRRLLPGALLLAATLTAPAEDAPVIPQPPLPTIRLVIGNTSVKAEVADEPHERNLGLMARTELADGEGMLFVFPEQQPMSFWMRNTPLPLSIAYINGAGVIREIHDMEPLKDTPIRSVFRDLLYALEVPQGWFSKTRSSPATASWGSPRRAPPRPIDPPRRRALPAPLRALTSAAP